MEKERESVDVGINGVEFSIEDSLAMGEEREILAWAELEFCHIPRNPNKCEHAVGKVDIVGFKITNAINDGLADLDKLL
ncbi:hypothetical protein CC2G_015110 [Coprinopsis cinerea AmutBmut pab1-1]|nr:hypothetical protein CC2G_015110 [Coprinopsis cinerea AmutBmut pab1-1]